MGQDTAWQSMDSAGSWKTSLLEWQGGGSSAALGASQLLSTLEHPEERLLHQETHNNRTFVEGTHQDPDDPCGAVDPS